MVSDEKQQLSMEALEAARIACNKYLTMNAGRGVFQLWDVNVMLWDMGGDMGVII